MVAAFDYNPRESSPNMDVEVRTPTDSPAKGVVQGLPRADVGLLGFPQAELPFRAGDIITVFGDMDDDGFYYVRTWGGAGSCYIYPLHQPFQGGLYQSQGQGGARVPEGNLEEWTRH